MKICIGLTGFLLLFAAAQGFAVLPVQSVTVYGEITNAQGTPVEGDVTVMEGGQHVRSWSFKSDPTGRFSFQARVGSNLTVVAKADGHLSSENVFVAGIDPPALEFKLSTAGRVSGRVIDVSGNGIDGASIAVRYSDERRVQFGQEIAPVTSDAFGYFLLSSVARDRPFTVDVAAPNHTIVASAPMTLRGESMTGVSIVIEDTGQLVRGRVTDQSGYPVPNLLVEFKWLGENSHAASETSILRLQANRSVKTDNNGSFEFLGVPEGNVALYTSQCGRTVMVDKVTHGTPLEVTIVLPCVRP